MSDRYDIRLSGCDDYTDLLDVELTDTEHAIIARIAALATEAGGGCMPTMRIEPAPTAPADWESCQDCYGSFGDVPFRRTRYGWVHQTCAAGAES